MENLVNEETYNNLLNNTKRNFDSPRETNARRVQVVTTAFIPSDEGLEIKAKTRTNNATYDTIIFLKDIQYVNGDDNNSISIKSPDGSDINIIPFNGNVPIEVNCSCLDFYYRFSVWNSKSKALYGDPPPPYVRKTNNRMPVNPKQVAGLCKHIIELYNEAKRDKIIT